MGFDMTIMQLEDTFIEDINSLDDWFFQYEYLLEISADMPRLDPNERTEKNRIPGCQSGVWALFEFSEGRIWIRADSEALIVRGIVSIYVQLLNGRKPKEVLEFRPRFIEQTNIKKQISTDRFHGLHLILERIQAFAVQCINAENHK